MHRLRTRVARRTRRQPEECGNLALCVRHDISWARDGVRLPVIGTPNRHRRVVRVAADVPRVVRVTCHGSYGDRYKQKTCWGAHVTLRDQIDVQPRDF